MLATFVTHTNGQSIRSIYMKATINDIYKVPPQTPLLSITFGSSCCHMVFKCVLKLGGIVIALMCNEIKEQSQAFTI